VADRSPESVWVTVTECYGDNVFGGRVLNPPQQFMGYAWSSGCARCDAEFENQPQPKTWWQFWK
jgi:hypothetical protein